MKQGIQRERLGSKIDHTENKNKEKDKRQMIRLKTCTFDRDLV